MGLSHRLRERREQLGLTQGEVAALLDITPGAIGNYENGVSTPKADILFRVFDALKCDANYLFQDEMKELQSKDQASPLEMETLVKKYRELDKHGKEMVDFALLKEWERSIDNSKNNIYDFDNKIESSLVAEASVPYGIQAAHQRTDIDIPDDVDTSDDEFFDK